MRSAASSSDAERITTNARSSIVPRWTSQAVGVKRGSSAQPSNDALQPFADKVCTPAQAVQVIRPGDRVFVGTACATPLQLLAALEARQPVPAGVELLHFLTDQSAFKPMPGRFNGELRHRSLFVGANMRDLVSQGRADYVPISLARVPGLMAINRIPLDGRVFPDWALWLRIPLQFVLIAWIWWVSRPPTP